MHTTKGNGLTADNSQPAKTLTNIAIIPLDKAAGKLEATLIAQFALAGHAVHRGTCGDYSITRWGLCRYCQDLDALQAFARQVGVAS